MLAPGVVLADRFVLGPPLGAGAMGQVFQAVDRLTGATVAIKVMLRDDRSSAREARFAAEIGVLSELAHPGIVRYVAHGETDDEQPYLVMEHLEGEDLEARLARGPLTVHDSVLLVERVASALDEAHRRGIVHRDIKPSNLFLRGGAIDRVTLLDFGIARRAGAGRAMTRTGAIIGTPEYMAPEQARGARDLGPQVDVFALGGVLYHCLVGQPPFTAEHVMATLVKILFEEPTPLESMRPDVPSGVVALLGRMLEKSPEARLKDGGAVLASLAGLRDDIAIIEPGAAPMPVGLGGAELELVTVIVVARPARLDSDETIEAAPATAQTADDAAAGDMGAQSVLRAFGARGLSAQRLADGTIVATLAGGPAIDQALEATSCARLAHERWPGARVAVATARRVAGTALPVGEAVERAASLIASREASSTPSRVLLDGVTAGLIDGRAHVVSGGPGSTSERDAPRTDTSRLLLGKPTPCVGREQELAMLEMTMSASFEQGASGAVLVVAPPGLGKSRLRHELSRRVDRRSADARSVLRLEARAEALCSGSPHALLAQALRGVLGLAKAGPAASCSDLASAVEQHVPGDAAFGVAEILGELCDLPFPDEGSVRLRAARQDSRLMQARIGDALVALLRGMCARHDVLVILEDLHWADRATLDLIGLALRELEDQPLFVVAFARPEIGDLVPDLWKGRVVEVPLRPLGRRACERLIERVVGDRLTPEVIAKIAERCDGNALYLEELVRASCDGKTDAAPETVLAMLQARIGNLATSERRTLRAASVFGEAFQLEGVCAVLGPSVDARTLAPWLAALAREEIIEPQRDQLGSYRFRHALMRDAAYGLLIEEDRRVGHRLAGAFLAGQAHDAVVVAEHFLRGDHPRDAAPWFLKAAQRAHDRDDALASDQLAKRGRAAGARGEVLGALGALEGWSAVLRWDWPAATGLVTEALTLLRAGTMHWCVAMRGAVQLAAYRNDAETLRACLDRFLSAQPEESASTMYCDAAVHLASAAIQVGLTGLGRALLARFDETIGAEIAGHASLSAWRNVIGCTLHRHTDDDLGAQLGLLGAAIVSYEAAGASAVMSILAQDILGEVECRAGLVEEGRARLRGSHAAALALGTGLPLAHARLALANGLLAGETSEAHEEAARLADELLATVGISAGYQAMARDVLSKAWLTRGDASAAASEARKAIALSPHTPVRRWLMAARLTEALVALGDASEARAVSTGALDEIAAAGDGGGYAELPLLLAAARASDASGARDEASARWERARAWCARQAASFTSDEVRARYLRHVESIWPPGNELRSVPAS